MKASQSHEWHMVSPTHGHVSVRRMCEIIADFVLANPHDRYVLGIGTDSQNYDDTKVVSAVYVHRVGCGAIVFYDVSRVPKVSNIHRKMLMETGDSIALADEVVGLLTSLRMADGRTFSIDEHDVQVELHCDVGTVGRSRETIRDVVGWVEACGYVCKIKPYSTAASSLANKVSK
jgi:predicted RNase H-related nuclease YkuK (DUF458 family)